MRRVFVTCIVMNVIFCQIGKMKCCCHLLITNLHTFLHNCHCWYRFHYWNCFDRYLQSQLTFYFSFLMSFLPILKCSYCQVYYLTILFTLGFLTSYCFMNSLLFAYWHLVLYWFSYSRIDQSKDGKVKVENFYVCDQFDANEAFLSSINEICLFFMVKKTFLFKNAFIRLVG